MDPDTLQYLLGRIDVLCQSWLGLMDELNPDDLPNDVSELIADVGVKIAGIGQRLVEIKRNET